ncbi:nickel/cobalt efflux transporter RcnA, partial [Salmonella enterica subsp. enterica serovar Derby]|nr:nickel/cobalt efflux transporter RcnA [Salmonella enterica subsp. enterica serovar Derby]
AFWMFWRTWQGEQNWLTQTHHDHDHDDHHHHHNHGEAHHHHHEHDHDHDHNHAALAGLSEDSKAYQDAHERAHATDIQRRFAGKEVTNGQILLFGLTGGLIPCPAAITVLLICIQLKAFTLGATMVLCFSLGLALTLVTVGVGAAISVQQAAKRWSGFNTLARKAPYFSSVLIAMVGL